MTDMLGDKTHDPTARRRRQAREAGRVAQSYDLSSAILLLGSLAIVMLAGAGLVEMLAGALHDSLNGDSWRSLVQDPQAGSRLLTGPLARLLPALARALLPVLVGATLLTLAASWLQSGLLLRPQRIVPELGRVNPLTGLRRVFSGASLVRVGFGVLKVAVAGGIAAGALWSRREELAMLAALGPADLAARIWDICLSTTLTIGAVLLALAAVDYLYQRWRLEQELKMTPDEVRQEMRELEGDPQVAARRRELRSLGGVASLSAAAEEAGAVPRSRD